ncbi:MAG TPA: molecular chaperone HtpG, partial [Rhizobiales bacterium]|nr:molecular chaperone HtpG [Hyphomicrobiales bacterium]
AGAGGPDLGLEKILKHSKGEAPAARHVLELNPDHKIIRALAEKTGEDKALISEAAHLLLDQARILEGEVLEDPAGFVKRLNALILKGME